VNTRTLLAVRAVIATLFLAGRLPAAQELQISGYFKNFSVMFRLPQTASAGSPCTSMGTTFSGRTRASTEWCRPTASSALPPT